MPEQPASLNTISTVHDSAFELPDTAIEQQPVIEPWLPSSQQEQPSRSRKRIVAKKGEPAGRQSNIIWPRRSLWLGAVAVSLSLAFTLLLVQDEPMRTRAWLGLIASGLLAILAWGGQPWPNLFARPASMWPLERITPERALRLAGIGLAIIFIWSANQQFLTHQNETFGLAGWLWLASMGLLLASVAAWPSPGQNRLGKSAHHQTQNSKLKTQNSLPSPALDSLAAIEQATLHFDVTLPYDSAA